MLSPEGLPPRVFEIKSSRRESEGRRQKKVFVASQSVRLNFDVSGVVVHLATYAGLTFCIPHGPWATRSQMSEEAAAKARVYPLVELALGPVVIASLPRSGLQPLKSTVRQRGV